MSEHTSSAMEASFSKKARHDKSHDILTCTIKAPPFSYAHLELITEDIINIPVNLDEIQVKSYCTAALKQFLGLTGAGMPMDILKAQGNQCWVRVERQDLGSFAAAITAWRGTVEDGVQYLLRVKQCSDWLGTIVGSDGHDRLWT